MTSIDGCPAKLCLINEVAISVMSVLAKQFFTDVQVFTEKEETERASQKEARLETQILADLRPQSRPSTCRH